jgi:hypothetical protein
MNSDAAISVDIRHLLPVQDSLEFSDFDVVSGTLHPSSPPYLTINEDELSTILTLLPRICKQGCQSVCRPDQRPHEAVLNIVRLLAQCQVASHAKGIISNARRVGIDLKVAVGTLLVR